MDVDRVRRLAEAVHDVTGRCTYPVPMTMAEAAGIPLSAGPGTCSIWERALYGVSTDRREQGSLMTAALAGTILLRAGIRAQPESIALLVVELLVPDFVFGLAHLQDVVLHHTWAPSTLITARWLSMRETGRLTEVGQRSVA